MKLHKLLCTFGLHYWQEHRRGPKHAQAWSDCVCGVERNVVSIAKPEPSAPLFEEKA